MKLFNAILLLSLPFICLPEIHGNDGAKEAQQEEDWLEYYYQNPTPDRFVPQMKDWADDGTLDNERAKPALIAFLSRVLRENRDRVKEWYSDLSGLTPAQKQLLHTAMLFARVSEADELMFELFGNAYREQREKTPKILEMPLDKEETIDMLWGFYYATGSENALRRIVLCFRFEDAPTDPGGVEIPEGYMPLYKALPDFAFNSLLANAERHPKVMKALIKFYEDDESLITPEKNGVYDILSELDPEGYPPVDREGRSA